LPPSAKSIGAKAGRRKGLDGAGSGLWPDRLP